MRRYEGFLRGTQARRAGPEHIWIVAVGCAVGPQPPRTDTRRSCLQDWSAIALDCDGTSVPARVSRSGRTAGEFWEAFLGRPHPKGSLWVISPRALMAWQLLGLWERIESGIISVARSGSGQFGAFVSGRAASPPGLLVTNDPPTAGKFTHVESELSFTWTCAANYGLQLLTAGADSTAEAGELASRVLSMLRVLSDYRLGGLGITAGSIALSGWRSTYDGPPLYVPTGRDGDALETRAVAGGLLYARATGPEPVTAYAVDCRSMYPHICAHYPQGVDLLQRDLRGPSADGAVRSCPLAALAEVDVTVDEPLYPQRTATGVVYPTGGFRTVLAGPELQEALKHGHIKRVHGCHTYRLGVPLADYQRRVWQARQQCENGDYAGAAPFIKRLGVSLIGKFAQRLEVWAEVPPDLDCRLWGSWVDISATGDVRQMRARAGIVEAQIGTEVCSHTLMSIALWVWSWGRVKMNHWISLCGRENVLYVDTDGMLLAPAGYDCLIANTPLQNGSWGALRRLSGPTPCVIRGTKCYTLGERIVQAGFPVNQRRTSSEFGESAWYRLPWDRMRDPGQEVSWVERLR